MVAIILVALRIIIGIFFVVVSGDKLLHPYQNFLYVVQGYRLFPPWAEEIIAIAVPWVEFFLGLFLLLGLWLRLTVQVFMGMVGAFVLLLVQALVRKLPLQDCGCFGSLLSFPVPATLAMDIVIFTVLAIMLVRLKEASRLSVDEYFAQPQRRQ